MGPNGSGKSTLAQVLAGHPGYEITSGSVTYQGKDLLDMEPEERAQDGVFLAFQYPVEIPGVSNAYFLRSAYNEIRKARKEPEADPIVDRLIPSEADAAVAVVDVGEDQGTRDRWKHQQQAERANER